MNRQLSQLLVIGGGAAGLCAAAVAGRLGVPAIVLERTDQPGRKLALTGGRKGNFTHVESPRQMVRRFDCDPTWLLPILRRVPYQRVISFFASLGIAARTDETGCVWPVRVDAAGLRDALLREIARTGGMVRTGARVSAIQPNPWQVQLADGEKVAGENILLATGGASYPQTGSTGDGLLLAQQLGIRTTPWFPALASLRTADNLGGLAGISQPLVAMTLLVAGEPIRSGRGHFIFAHDYVSGSSVLNLAGYAARALARGQPVELVIDWQPDQNHEELVNILLAARNDHPRQLLGNFLGRFVARRLALVLLDRAGVTPSRLLAQLSRAEAVRIAGALKATRFAVIGTEPIERATATGGGIQPTEIDNRTMQVRRLPGLYCAGEVLDLWAETGGYNLHFAWTSAIIAAEAISGRRLG